MKILQIVFIRAIDNPLKPQSGQSMENTMKTSRSLSKRLAAAAFLAVLATVALAQGPGGQGGPPDGPGGQRGPGGNGPRGMRQGPPPAVDHLPPLVSLVRRPEVSEELGLSDDQQSKIDEILQAMPRGQGGPGGLGDGPGGPPPQDGPPQGGPGQGGGRGGFGPGARPGGPEGRTARDKAEATADAAIKAILTQAQAKRLAQIQIQTMGLAAAMVPSVQLKLGLSDDQKEKLRALMPPRRQGEPGQGGPGLDGPGQGGPGQGGPGGPPPDGGFGGGPGGPPPDMQGGQGGPPPDMGGQGGFGGGRGGPGQRGPGGGSPGRGGPGGRNDGRRQALEAKIAAILTSDQKAALKALGGKPLAQPGQNRPPEGP